MLSKLFKGFVSENTTGREREAVAVCYLCGCIVAHCGGVILQVAGTLLHRKTAKSKMPSITLSYQSLAQGIKPRMRLNSEFLII